MNGSQSNSTTQVDARNSESKNQFQIQLAPVTLRAVVDDMLQPVHTTNVITCTNLVKQAHGAACGPGRLLRDTPHQHTHVTNGPMKTDATTPKERAVPWFFDLVQG